MPGNLKYACNLWPWRGLFSRWIAGIFLVLVILPLWGCDLPFSGEKKTVIRLHDDQIDMLKINNAVVEFIIEKGYGYPVERVERTTKEILKLLSRGDIDLSLEMWWDNHPAWFQNEVRKKKIVTLGPLYSGRQFWMIPRWVAEQYNIRTVSDMRRHRQLFQDPDDPSKGLFFNCITGWTCLEINERKLRAYGLDKYYNAASPSSPEALTMIFRNAQLKKIPVFGYYWSPNALMAAYGWQILEEPPFRKECWDGLVKATETAEDPDCACAYGKDNVHKVAGARLLKSAPDVVEMLKKMKMDVKTLNEVLKQGRRNGELGGQQSAMYFLHNFEPRWKQWVAPEAFKKIRHALAEAGTGYD